MDFLHFFEDENLSNMIEQSLTMKWSDNCFKFVLLSLAGKKSFQTGYLCKIFINCVEMAS